MNLLQMLTAKYSRPVDVKMSVYDVILIVMSSLAIWCSHGASVNKYNGNDVRSEFLLSPDTPAASVRLLVGPRDSVLRFNNKVTIKCRVKVIAVSPEIVESLRVGFNVSCCDVQLIACFERIVIDSFRYHMLKLDSATTVVIHYE